MSTLKRSFFLRHRSKESGFTLIELLTVIVIIGILAAIAIPVFQSQRARATDAQVVSDVRNAVTQTESYLADPNNKVADLSATTLDHKTSPSVLWAIKGNTSTNGYCIVAYSPLGKKYATQSTALTYDSTAGGLGKNSGSCAGTDSSGNSNTPSVGSITSTPASVIGTWNGQSTLAPDLPANAPSTMWAGANSLSIYQITSDDTYFYAASRDQNAVFRVSKTDGTTWTKFATASGIDSLVYLKGYLYGTSQAGYTLYRINPANGAVSTLGSFASDGGTGISTDGNNTLYVREYAAKQIRAIVLNPDGASIASNSIAWSGLTQTTSSGAPLYSNNSLVTLDNGKLVKKDINTGVVTTLVSNIPNDTVSAYESQYWQIVGGKDIIYAADNKNGKIIKIDLRTSAVTTIATGFTMAIGLSTDGRYLYASQYGSPGGITRIG